MSSSDRRTLLGSALRRPLWLFTIVVTLLGAGVTVAAARTSTTQIAAGDRLFVQCSGDRLGVTREGAAGVRLDCRGTATSTATSTPTTTPTATPSSTATVTPTATPPAGAVGICGESNDHWHPPVIGSCAAEHEHGDAPPAWIEQAGYHVSFHGHFNTSAAENTVKHAAMKGFTARFNDVDVYFRVHAASNPGDRSARYHSYEVWARDPAGGVSHWQGWYNSGDPRPWNEGGARVPRRTPALAAESQRPLILVTDETALAQGIGCEQWYSAPGEPIWGWDFGWTICGSSTVYHPGENADAFNVASWTPTGSVGDTRRLEASWYQFRPHPTGTFWATQFGELVTGPSDARCAATTTKFGVTYPNACLEQHIAPTMPQVSFPGNAVQKDFPSTGVRLPN